MKAQTVEISSTEQKRTIQQKYEMRQSLLCFIIILQFATLSVAQKYKMACERDTAWKDDMLAGIDHLPSLGSLGIIQIQDGYRHLVEPILHSDHGDIVAVAGKLGEGRVVVIAHEGYAKDFKQGSDVPGIKKFHANIKSWVSNGQIKNPIKEVVLAKNMEKKSDYKVLFWNGGKLDDGLSDRVYDFVLHGGGLVHAMCPGGWLQRNKGKKLHEMPLAGLLDTIGITFGESVLTECNAEGFHIDRGEVCHQELVQVNEQCENPEPDGWENFTQKSTAWRADILHNVASVPRLGSPGSCIAYGRNAFPIVKCQKTILMAGSEVEKGRVIIISHGQYVKNPNHESSQLMNNVYAWVSNGKYSNKDDIIIIEGKKSEDILVNEASSKKIIIWTAGSEKPGQSEKVMQFINNGGGLVMAMTPWGWLQQHKDKTIDDMPLANVLESAGLAFSKNTCAGEKEFAVNLNESESVDVVRANVGYLLDYCTSMSKLEKYGEDITQSLDGIGRKTKLALADNVKVLFDRFNNQMQYPCSKKPLRNPAQRTLTILCDLLCTLGHCDMDCIPCVDTFPGCCKHGNGGPELICVEREFSDDRHNFHSTGVYAPPGIDVKVIITNPTEVLGNGWSIRIGSHKDNLTKKDTWKRWPKIISVHKIMESEIVLKSPYGGLVYLENPDFKNKYHTIKVRIEGVIEAPHFDLNAVNSKQLWLSTKDSPAPWADMCGKRITITMPSDSVRHINDPTEVMEVWDRVVEAHYALQSSDPVTHRHQWVVTDEQPSVGYMHSGYPIVTHLDVSKPTEKGFLLDHQALITTGRWGMFHELGHNMQRKMWTPKGTGEVTCNIFTLHAMDVIAGQKPWIHEWLAKQMPKIKKALLSDDPYKMWMESPGVALGIYAQLQNCFGWQVYKDVFTHYERLADSQKPQSDQEKLDYWVKVFSETAKYNLCPLYDFWQLPVGEVTRTELASLPAFLPDDEMTQMAPDRVEKVEQQYIALIRNV